MFTSKRLGFLILIAIATALIVGCSTATDTEIIEETASDSAQENADPTEEVVEPTEEEQDEPTEEEEAEPSEEEPEPVEEEETPAPVASEEGKLVIWVDGGRVEIMQQLGDDFAEEYGVEVAVQELGFGDVRDQLKIVGPAGEGPDIIIGAHDWLGELVTNGLLRPLDLGEKADNFDPVALEAFTYEGTLYGLPYNTEAIALYYNKDLVPDPPETWEELKAIAEELQANGTVEQGYVLQEGDPYHTYPIFTGFGGYVFGLNDDGSYNPDDLGLDSPGALAAAQELDGMVQNDLLRAGVDYGLMMSLFTEGQAAFMITGPWALNDVRASDVNYGIANIPAMEETARPFVGVQGFMISAFGENQLLAQTFLTESVATDETMLALYEAVPNAPAWLPLRETIDDEDILAFAASAATGDPMPAIPQMSAVWEAWRESLIIIFQQQQPAEEAMQDAATTIRQEIDESGN